MWSLSASLRLALATDPLDPIANADLVASGEHIEAPQVIETQLEEDADNSELRYRAGVAYLRHGECTYALHHLEMIPVDDKNREDARARIEEAHGMCSRVKYHLKKSPKTSTVHVEYQRIDRGAFASWSLTTTAVGNDVVLYLSPGTWRVDFYGSSDDSETTHTAVILDVDKQIVSLMDVEIPPNKPNKRYLAAALTSLFLGYAVAAPLYGVGKYRLDHTECDETSSDCRDELTRFQHMTAAGWGTVFAANGSFLGTMLGTVGERAPLGTLAAGGAFSLAGGLWVGMSVKNLVQWHDGAAPTRLESQHVVSSGFLGLGLGLITSSVAILAANRRSKGSGTIPVVRVSSMVLPRFVGIGLAGRF